MLKRPLWIGSAAIGLILIAIVAGSGGSPADSRAILGFDAASKIPTKEITADASAATLARASAAHFSNRTPARAQGPGRASGCSIIGKVCDAGGAAVPGAEIVLIRREMFPLLVGKFGRSDANGNFQFRDLDPGTFGFRFRAPNHAVRVCFPKYVADTDIPMDVGAIALESQATISGCALHESGAPERNIRVSVCWDRCEEEADGTHWRVADFVNAYTDRDGRFSVGGLPRQHVTIYAVGANGIPSDEIDVPLSTERGAVSDLVLRTYVARDISGFVCDAAGLPIPDADIVLKDPQPLAICASDAQGRFRIRGLRPGEHTIRIEPQTKDGVRYSPVEKTIQAGGPLETIVLVEEVVKGTIELEGDWK